ncbi:Beta-1,4-galactosyltransferase 5 [Holothuria leucospilota]|uniref:Beta-1,4-galactosyltransferase n=1 Tax=Holothuria leucospilota TaxID=206669 RepID=A0A9Q1C337_HOLLE|nr:Beta-1,4-galactosyltransferase 5 [Holothuria leucospilota]
MSGKGSPVPRLLQPLERFNLIRASYWFVWTLIILATLSTLALWASLDSTYGIYTTSSKGRSGGVIGLFRGFFEDTKSYMRQHQIRTYVGGLTAGQPPIVCPEIDIPGSKKNLTIDVNEIDLPHVEEEIFREYLFDVRKFSSDVTQDVAAMYRHKHKASQQGLVVKDVVSEGIKVGEDYWYVPGGHWIPSGCIPRWKVAVIIPFRDRFVHLPIILRHLVPFLKSQYLEFGIFFVEQANELQFNRAMLMNVGYLEALNFTQWDCFIFHDVDHIPLSYGNYYGCSSMPKHFLSGADRWGYKLLYSFFFGAVTGFTRTQVAEFNGFPNVYWGWGGEDDDILGRMRSIGLAKTRPWGPVGWYNVIPHHHKSAKKNTNRVCLLDHYRQRLLTDGLSNLKYETPTVTLNPLYTNISVNIHHLPWNDAWLDCREDA